MGVSWTKAVFPSEENNFLMEHVQLLRNSYLRFTGMDMLDVSLNPEEFARQVYHLSAVVLSHGTQADPVLNYVNRAGLNLFELDWETMLTMPSRLTAEPMEREERQVLLDKVSADGFIDDYSGVRISSTGRRFKIEKATVWNLVDETGVYRGQAAMFSDWKDLD